MLCWETAFDCHSGKNFCHRHLVAQWLEDRLGIEVLEVSHPNLERFVFLKQEGVPVLARARACQESQVPTRVHAAARSPGRSVGSVRRCPNRLIKPIGQQSQSHCQKHWNRRGPRARRGYCLGIRLLKRQKYRDEPLHNCTPRITVTM
jgi:hypothetical protein